MGVHDGHRDRMKRRFIEYGGQSFNDHELIEMLLYYVYPRIDTNEKAHKVLDEFGGSITRLINSDPNTIARVCGMNPKTAVIFSLVGEINRRMAIEKWHRQVVLDSVAVAGEYAISYLDNLNVEKLYVVCLNSNLAVINCVGITDESADSVRVDEKRIVEIAIINKASNIILMHNHTSGNIKPSYSDIEFTMKCFMALKAIKVNLGDHIIVAEGKYLSFKEEGILKEEA